MSGLSGIVKLVIFGATGQTGRLLTERGVAKGHQVTAFVRDPARFDLPNGSVRAFRGASSIPPRSAAPWLAKEASLLAPGPPHDGGLLRACRKETLPIP